VVASCFELITPELWTKLADVSDAEKRVLLGTGLAACVVTARQMLRLGYSSSQDCATVLPCLVDMVINSRASQRAEPISNLAKVSYCFFLV